MRLIAWILVCVLVAVLGRRRPVEVLAAAFAFAVFVPYVASPHFTGETSGRMAFAAVSWLVGAVFVVRLCVDPWAFLQAMTRRFLFHASILLVLAAAVFETSEGASSHGLVNIVDEMIIPYVAFWTVTATGYRTPAAIDTLRRAIVGVAVIEASYALLQQAAHRILLFNGSFHREYWYAPGYHRWMGTTDSPLVLSLLLCAAIPMLKSLRRPWMQNVANVILLGGIVVAQSRTGLIVGGIATVYLLLSARSTVPRKVISVAVLVGSAVAIIASGLSAGVSDRISNDSGSATGHDDAYSYFFAHWQPYVFNGGGIRFSYQLSEQAGLVTTSFESAFVMYSFDLGVVFAAWYFIAQIGLALRSAPHDRTGAWMSVLVVVGLCQTFSSLGPARWSGR
jgi:hypothetical protein